MRIPTAASDFFAFLFSFGKKRSAVEKRAHLESLIGYHFRDPSLLSLALTHKSKVPPEDKMGLKSNERLEFLGDAVLNCCITEHLYFKYPQKSEGQLSKIKSLIVSGKILAQISDTIGFGSYLLLGHGEDDSGGRRKTSILSNTFESILGAVYLDGGLHPARGFLVRFLFGRIDEFLQEKSNYNYKSKILEVSQRDGFGIPQYKVLSTSGPEHCKVFTVQILIDDVPMGEGSGHSKKRAQQIAAKRAIEKYSKSHITAHYKGELHDELVSDGRAADDHRNGQGSSGQEDTAGT
ncbi:MAG: ribonuclease III [Chitinivibrionales bacterium]|nr:ribonuclease III [Chitinivibrionales bacterium]